MKKKNDEIQKKQCDVYDPLVYDCSKCPELDKCRHALLEYHQQIPHYLTDGHLMQLKPTALKVFIYLNRLAHYKIADANYGKCTVTYATMSKRTGVAKTSMPIYIKELKDCGLIDYDNIDFTERDNKYHTGHEYTMIHLMKKKELKIDDQADNPKTMAPTKFDPTKDEHPEMTGIIKQLWKENNLPGGNEKYDENNFRTAAIKFKKFLLKYKHQISFSRVELLRPNLMIQYLYSALLYDAEDAKSKITTGWISSDMMFNSRLPKYFYDQGMADCFEKQFSK